MNGWPGTTKPTPAPRPHPREADNDRANRVSQELERIGVDHHITIKHIGDAVPEERRIGGVCRFVSVREFAAALERAGVDATYSAAEGWKFFPKASV